MTIWEKFLSWYHAGEFEELRVADTVQRMASATRSTQTDGLFLVCPDCRNSDSLKAFYEHGECRWCGWKFRR